jgi:hypothetical protein
MLNPTVVGTALTFGTVSNSSLDADFATTNGTTLTGGTILYTGTADQGNSGGGQNFCGMSKRNSAPPPSVEWA